MTAYRPRELTPRLVEALRHLPVVVLSGLRQCGKSTLLTKDRSFRDRAYRTLDDFAVLEAARTGPEALVEAFERLTLDEVQRCPELLPVVKAVVDRRRQGGRFLLSGSANLALIARVTETLAGRAGYIPLFPMTRREIRRQTRATPALVQFITKPSLPSGPVSPVTAKEILLGGMPPVCLKGPRGASVWFSGYVQTYVERDVRQLSQIADLIAFRNLASLAALRTAQILNTSMLGRDAKLSVVTTSRYLHLLETSFLIRTLPPFLRNRSSRLIKSPKLYYTDSGLAAFLAGVRSLGTGGGEPLHGALLETYVVQNVSAILTAHLPDATLSYWHEQGRHEVDLVIESGAKVVAIEIKASTRWSDSDLAGLKAFLDRTPQCTAAVLAYNGSQAVPLGRKLWAIPLGRLLA